MQNIKKTIHFMTEYKWKKITVYAWIMTAYYRLCILCIPSQRLEKKWGKKGQESPLVESKQAIACARKTAWIIDVVAKRTPWESKCLVRALTAQHMMKRHNHRTTLYLGVGKDEHGDMVAHAWLRCGDVYITGGDGNGYGMVAKFLA